jgi:hypothetical protein
MTDLHKTKVINNEHTNNYYFVMYSRICNGLQDIGHGLFDLELTSYMYANLANPVIPALTSTFPKLSYYCVPSDLLYSLY